MAQFMPLRQEAPMLVGVLWMFVLIAFILVGLRLYTRLVVLHNYGMDDHFFNISVFCLLAYVILLTIATRYGLGQEVTDYGSPEAIRALLLVNVGQTIIFVAVIAVKISIACFLLRIVGTFTAKQFAIILPVTIMSLAVFITAIVLWFSCTPISFVWDISTPGGYCDLEKQFWAAVISGVTVILAELWYASYPWYLIKGLQMPKREKILIGTSMSVSYISAGCSIARMISLLELTKAHEATFLVAIVDGLIWHAADITTQLFCIGVTVCRPLYKDWLYRVADHIEGAYTRADTTNSSAHGTQRGRDAVALRSIGGGVIKPDIDGAGRKHGRPTHASKKPGAAIRRELVFQTNVDHIKPGTLPPISTQPNFEKATFSSVTSRKY